jgi:hypothetical protein
MHYQLTSLLTSMLESRSLTELHEQFYPIIEGLPPAPGCHVNWMWHLAVFERQVYAKVSERITNWLDFLATSVF